MKDRKNIIIVLTIVLVMALLIEIARTEYLFILGKNDNEHYSLFTNKINGSSSAVDVNRISKENYLVIYDKQDENSTKVKDNILRVLTYMKKTPVGCDIKDYKGIDDNYRAVIITFERLKSFQGIDDLVSYVSNGGKAFFAARPAADGVFYNLSQKLGIYEVGNWVGDIGIKLLSNVLIKGKGTSINDNTIYNEMVNVQLRKECTIYAESLKGTPMLWDVAYGSGKFMVFNGTSLTMKMNRGLIAGAISLLNKDFVYPVMNIKLSFIDDFPAPIPKEYIDNIHNGYGRSLPNFYREVWWADILKGAKNYDMKYTSMIIETYDDIVEPPFEGRQGADVNSLIVYGREIIKSGGELGIHGYNHQPLAEDGFIREDTGYAHWESGEDMSASLIEVKNYINKIFPRYNLRVYSPPSNILSPMGRRAVVKGLSDIAIISSQYLSDFTGGAYVQEYEVNTDGIVELPRISYGYDNNYFNNWSILNGITSVGVFSHYIQPDDVVVSYKNGGKTWDQMSKEYSALLEKVYENYEWLRSMTASQGGAELKNYLNCETFIEYNEESINIYCNNFPGELYFILRTDKKATANIGCEVHKIDDGVYLINAKKPDITINLSR